MSCDCCHAKSDKSYYFTTEPKIKKYEDFPKVKKINYTSNMHIMAIFFGNKLAKDLDICTIFICDKCKENSKKSGKLKFNIKAFNKKLDKEVTVLATEVTREIAEKEMNTIIEYLKTH